MERFLSASTLIGLLVQVLTYDKTWTLNILVKWVCEDSAVEFNTEYEKYVGLLGGFHRGFALEES